MENFKKVIFLLMFFFLVMYFFLLIYLFYLDLLLFFFSRKRIPSVVHYCPSAECFRINLNPLRPRLESSYLRSINEWIICSHYHRCMANSVIIVDYLGIVLYYKYFKSLAQTTLKVRVIYSKKNYDYYYYCEKSLNTCPTNRYDTIMYYNFSRYTCITVTLKNGAYCPIIS